MIATKLALGETDALRRQVNSQLDPSRKSTLGQFMTPSVIADFMAGLFEPPRSAVRLLDPGAGIGSLSVAAVQRLGLVESLDAWEIDPLMCEHLAPNLDALGVRHSIHSADFIEGAVRLIASGRCREFTHAILNPPYKKLGSDSVHRALLRKVGIETVNLYSAFVALAILLLEPGGELVAIIPRSFCNGPYYLPFRKLLLQHCALERIHLFESRNQAFSEDAVLQENVIFKVVKGKPQGAVTLSHSYDQESADLSERIVPFDEILKPGDQQAFIHVPVHRSAGVENYPFRASLADLGVEVCTGPIVDFRLKQHWLSTPTPGDIPLLYPHHFASGTLEYPRVHKKPNALVDGPDIQKWLMPNECYVLVKRFSSKEERRRVVAYVHDPQQVDAKMVGFENHWNVFHRGKRGLDRDLAQGLACFLNSTQLDDHFRLFSGHTQVNAADLRNMKYPNAESLRALGRTYRPGMLQAEIDAALLQIHEQRTEDSAGEGSAG